MATRNKMNNQRLSPRRNPAQYAQSASNYPSGGVYQAPVDQPRNLNPPTSHTLNYDSARVAPAEYLQAAADQYQYQQPAYTPPQYQPAQASDFEACQVPPPVKIRIPQVTVRRHDYPIMVSAYDRVVHHETIEIPVNYQKVENPLVQKQLCGPAQSNEPPSTPCNCCPGMNSCSKSTFRPGCMSNQNASSAPRGHYQYEHNPYPSYGSPYY